MNSLTDGGGRFVAELTGEFTYPRRSRVQIVRARVEEDWQLKTVHPYRDAAFRATGRDVAAPRVLFQLRVGAEPGVNRRRHQRLAQITVEENVVEHIATWGMTLWDAGQGHPSGWPLRRPGPGPGSPP